MLAIIATLLAAIVLGVVVFLILYVAQRTARQAASRFETRFQEAQQIINLGQVPNAWFDDERRRIAELQRQGADPRAIARVGRRAKTKSLKRLRHLYNFLAQGSYYDSVESKLVVLEALQERQQVWQATCWQTLLALQPPEPALSQGENGDCLDANADGERS